MKNAKCLSVRKGYLAALAVAVVFSAAVKFGGSDVGPKNLQTAVTIPSGYTDAIWVMVSLPANTTTSSAVVTINHLDTGDVLSGSYNVNDTTAGALTNDDCGGLVLYYGKSYKSDPTTMRSVTAQAASSFGTGCVFNAALKDNSGNPIKLALGETGGTVTGYLGTSYTLQPKKSSASTQVTGQAPTVEFVVNSSYGQCDYGKYWDTATSTCITQPTCGNGTWDSATNACSYGSCTTDTWGLNKPECSPTATGYSDCRDPYYWYNKTSGVFEKCSKDAAVKADFCNNTIGHTPCETVKADRITLLEKAFATDPSVKTTWLTSSYPSYWWEPVWDNTQPYKKYDAATDSLVACTSNSTTWVSGQYNGTCQPVADKWKDWYLIKWRGEYAEWKKWNSTTTCDNDKYCDAGETIASCPADCGSTTIACDFDKVCDYGESTGSCPSDCGSTVTTCDNDKYCDAGETNATCPADCPSGSGTGSGWTPPSDWKEVIWNTLGLKSYVSINTPQDVIDAAKKACANTKPENVTWPNPSDFTKPATVGVPSCNGTIVTTCDNDKYCDAGETTASCPADCPSGSGVSGSGTVSGVARSCATGERCPKDSWCSNGKQCYYPDGNLTCLSWNTMGDNSCGKLAPGTKECSPSDTNCIEPGETGPVNGWCKQGMECFTSDGAKKYCQPYSYSNYGSGSNSCPAGYKICSPDDKTCIEPGATGPLGGWCKNSMECFTADGAQKFCQAYSNGPGVPSCPAGSKLCGANDPNCIEPGSTGSVDGWCKNSQECFSKDGTKKYCNAWPTTMPYAGGGNIACPAEYPNECRPDDKYCTELGETNSLSGAYCFPGGKQCYKTDGLFCVEEGTSCPKDSKKCPTNNFPNPVAYSPYIAPTSQCIEDEGPIDGWCGGTSAIQCYNNNGKTKKCIEVDSYNDPQAWENVACPTGYNRCAPNSPGCLGSIGAKGKKGDWCAIGMTKYNDDGTVTCVSGKDWMPEPTPLPKPMPICIATDTDVLAYDPANFDCKTFADSCNIPKNWATVTDGRVCKDGKLVNLEVIGNDDASIKQILNEKRKYLDDLELRLSALPAQAVGKEVVLTSIHDAQYTIKALFGLLPTKSATDRKILLAKVQNVVQDTIPDIEQKMSELKVYINYNSIRDEIWRDIQKYKAILDVTARASEYYKKLNEGVTRLESLLKNADTASGDVLVQLVEVVKTQWNDLQSLVDGDLEDRGNDFLADTIDDLNEALERFENLIADRGVDMPFVLNHMDKLRKSMFIVNEIDIEEATDSDRQRVHKAVKLRDKLALWLDERPRQDLVSVNKLMDMIDQKVVEAVDKAFAKFENKLEMMMDEQLKQVTIKLTELVKIAKEDFSSKFTEQVAQNASNLAAVPEAQKEALAQGTAKILDRTEAIVSGIDSIDNTEVSDFAKDSLLATMERVASNVWCGDYAQKVQSESTSIDLAIKAGKLDSEQITTFDDDVNEWVVENQQECYDIGVTPGRDVSPNSWPYPYVMYNKDHGYMKGYGGDRAGYFGLGDPTLRAEALAMIMRLLDVPEGNTATLDSDVTVTNVPEWAIGYVNGAKGFLERGWNMSQPITRAETARLFVAAMTSDVRAYIDLPTIFDAAKRYVDYAQFADDADTLSAVEALTDAGIFKGGGDGGFHPYDSLLRSEFAAVTERVDENLVEGQESKVEPK